MKSKTFSITTIADESLNTQTLIFEGNLGLDNAGAIKKTVESITYECSKVIIHLKNVQKLDITFIQILKALRIFLEVDGKNPEIISLLPSDIERLLINSGFNSIL
jgi:hypothetical protein